MHRSASAAFRHLAAFIFLFLLGGCGAKSRHTGGIPGSKPYIIRGKTYYPLQSAQGFKEEGIASWYGPGFHGKKTANGETYDIYAMTAAHKILPLGSIVRVQNLRNNRTLALRINDRGPFVDDRVIDLSRAAAEKLDIIGTGTARVRIAAIDDPSRPPPSVDAGSPRGPDKAGSRHYLQVGAYPNRDDALEMARQMEAMGYRGYCRFAPAVRMWRVRIGPFPSRDTALAMKERLTDTVRDTFIVLDD